PSFTDLETGSVVSNGQHLFMACYHATLRFLGRLGSLALLYLQPRLRVPFLDHGGRASALSLPALPVFSWSVLWGLMQYPGLPFRGRWGLLRVAREVRRRTRAEGRASADALDDRSVTSWLASLGQGTAAGERLWRPLAIAAL